jgi:hypothetical protein
VKGISRQFRGFESLSGLHAAVVVVVIEVIILFFVVLRLSAARPHVRVIPKRVSISRFFFCPNLNPSQNTIFIISC